MDLTQAYAQSKAQNWVDAWNRRDLDAVMAHYADDVSVCSHCSNAVCKNRIDGCKANLRCGITSLLVWETLIFISLCNRCFWACSLCRWFMHVKTEFRLLIRWS